MLARVRSAAVLGIDAYPVDVEVDITNGLPSFSTVGLPHGAVKEGRERVSAALANGGFSFPLRRITVNLAPADVRKDGSAFDLPIALGILVASGQIPEEPLRNHAVLGEVGLEGDLRPRSGCAFYGHCCQERGLSWRSTAAREPARGFGGRRSRRPWSAYSARSVRSPHRRGADCAGSSGHCRPDG